MIRENRFKRELKKELKNRYHGCMVLDLGGILGIPDLIVLCGMNWATLECKRYDDASRQPNQEFYVDKMNNMSFSHFIYPENKEMVLRDLDKIFLR